MVEYLNNGKSIALVSDRGTPLVSDPGVMRKEIKV
jgi:16S rRNA C1402 (ribose-2'-O) methylase RsmI